ncbi:MAG: hypothetical protein KDD66_04905 [Bdellovibrionales bacterium]|nr:hypothetical protein [Bdellovibrionales bacterium]
MTTTSHVTVRAVDHDFVRRRIEEFEDLLVRRMSEPPWHLAWERGVTDDPMSARGFLETFLVGNEYGVDGDYFVAMDGDKIVGFAIGVKLTGSLIAHLSLDKLDLDPCPQDGDYYHCIGILDTPYRQRGIYGQLVARRCECANGSARHWVRTHVEQETVWGLFETRLGFLRVKTYTSTPDDYGGHPLTRHVLRHDGPVNVPE